MTVTPPLEDWSPYADCCLLRCFASGGDERSVPSPKTEVTSPTENDVMLILAKPMASSIDSWLPLFPCCARQDGSHQLRGGLTGRRSLAPELTTSGGSGTLAMSNVPGANLLAAICCSRTLTNWRMRPHRSAAVSPALRDTTRQYAAISTFCTSLHEILGSLICSRLIASLISLVRSMRFSVANRPPPVASPIRSGTRPGPISGHSRFSAA